MGGDHVEDIYTVEGVCETRFNSTRETIYVKWHKLSECHHVRASVERQMGLVKSKRVKAIIVDVSTARGVPDQATQEWFGEVVFPAYEDHGLKALINIVP